MDRRRVIKILGLTVAGLTAAGLGAKAYWEDFQTKRRTNLLIAGSAPMISYVNKIIEAFIKSHNHIDISTEKGHSSGALIALERGGIDIAVMDRNLRVEEFDLNDHNYLSGMDGLGIVVHIDSPIKDVSIEQARKIFEGLIVNWKELGGPDAPINVYGRREGSTTRESIEDLLMDGASLSRRIKQLKSAKELSDYVASDPNGIGYISIRTMEDTTRALSINGIVLNEKNLLISLYPLTRPMFLVTNGESTPDIKKFLDFTLSDRGQEVLVETGMLRVR
jgi:phosphate transport system substrate-binding protein